MKKFFLLLVLSLYGSHALAAEHKIAVSIDSNPITYTDVKNRSKLIIVSSGISDNQKSYDMIFNKVLEILIDEKLIEKQAKKLGIAVTDLEINQAIASLATRNGIPPNQIFNFFKEKRINEHEIRKQLASQITWSKIIASQIQPQITVTPKEVADNTINIAKKKKQESEVVELKLAEIVLYSNNPSDGAKNKILAQELYAEAEAKDNFGELAKELSQAPTASSYGEIGWILSTQMPNDLATKLTKLAIGNIHIAYLPDGVHMLKVLDRKVISNSPKNLTDDDVRAYLEEKKLEIAIRGYLKKMRSTSHIQQYAK